MQSLANELHTIRDYIRYSLSRFYAAELYYGHGTDNAWDEAVGLVLHALHLPLNTDKAILGARLTDMEKEKVLHDISRRADERVPLPYITHEAWFAGLPFYVDERVLIPRSPIAELIEQQFEPWVRPERVHNILDLCTGSACIAIACAHAFPEAHVDAVDISADALDVAEVNVAQHELDEQVSLHRSDLFSELGDKRYDIIVSNPPYVSHAEMQTVPDEYKHEPNLALQADDEGLDIVIRMLKEVGKYLTPEGILIVEVGNTEEALVERHPEIPFTWLEFERGGHGVFMLTAQQVGHIL